MSSPPLRSTAGKVGMWLVLAALAMLFVAGLLAYLIVRLRSQNQIALGELTLPAGLWLSGFCLILAGFALEVACRFLRQEKQIAFRRLLLTGAALTVVFTLVQASSLLDLLGTHETLRERGTTLYGLVFLLILVHALHVLGGLVPFLVILLHALRGAYDHEQWGPVRYLTMYWHFLDIVWIALFGTMWLVG